MHSLNAMTISSIQMHKPEIYLKFLQQFFTGHSNKFSLSLLLFHLNHRPLLSIKVQKTACNL